MGHPSVSRRTLAKGAAWSVPAVAMAAAAPAVALSCPAGVAADVEGVFASYKQGLPSLTDVNFIISFHSAVHGNGALAEHSVHVTNQGTTSIDGTFPLSVDFAYRNVDTSPAVNTTFGPGTSLTNLFGTDARPVNTPWNPAGRNSAQPGDAVYVGQCGSPQTVKRRDLSWGTSQLDVYSPTTYLRLAQRPTEVGEELAECISGTDGAYGYALAVSSPIKAGDYVNVAATHIRDGKAPGGRIYVAQGMRVRGFFPPTWDKVVELVRTSHPKLADTEIESCYQGAYLERVNRWYASGESLAGATVSVAGWSRFYDSNADVMGWTRQITVNDWVWSNEVGNFMAAGTENDSLRISGVNTWSPSLVKTSSPNQGITEIRHRDGIL